jgi:hypothetical protein
MVDSLCDECDLGRGSMGSNIMISFLYSLAIWAVQTESFAVLTSETVRGCGKERKLTVVLSASNPKSSTMIAILAVLLKKTGDSAILKCKIGLVCELEAKLT